MNLFITGGHLTPALAVVDWFGKQAGTTRLYFVGRLFSQAQTSQRSREHDEMMDRGIPFFPLDAAKFHRHSIWDNALEILKFPQSCIDVFRMFAMSRPDVVLSFGGYVAFPVCLVAKLFGARIITHEQTASAGLANKLIGVLADKIAVANEESLSYFPKDKTVVTGNPIRESLLREYKVPPKWLSQTNKPLLYITGGSQGSHIINQTVAAIVPKLVRDFIVIHQCGSSQDSVYKRELEKVKEALPAELLEDYIVVEWIEAREVSYLMRNARIVISRAGANTVQELVLAGTPAIFIPLAFAQSNEQERNCVPLVKAGAAILLPQKDLFPDTLYTTIRTMARHYDRFHKHAQLLKQSMITDGSRRVAELVLNKVH